jgi:hypothetical protein
MTEKEPCIDCPVRLYRERTSTNTSITDVRIAHALTTRSLGIELPAKTLEEDALNRCDHWHRWGAQMNFGTVAVNALKARKEKRKIVHN